MTVQDAPKLFLSHAYKDKAYAEAFMDTILIQGSSLPSERILMTSLRETGIATGKNLFGVLRNTAAHSPLVVALITPTYLTRSTCLAELGAAWVKEALFPIMVGGITRKDLDGVLQGLIIEKFNDEDTLDELHETVSREFGVTTRPLAWSRKKKQWLGAAPKIELAKPTTFTAADKEKLDRKLSTVQAELKALTDEFDELSEQNEQLRKAKDADEVKAIVTPKVPAKHFEHLRQAATDALSEVQGGSATRDILRKYFAGRLDLPSVGDPLQDDYFEAQEAGMITIDDDDDGSTVTLVPDFYKLHDALDSIEELLSYFDDQIASNEDFKNWFVGKYKTTPKLTAEQTWKRLLR